MILLYKLKECAAINIKDHIDQRMQFDARVITLIISPIFGNNYLRVLNY